MAEESTCYEGSDRKLRLQNNETLQAVIFDMDGVIFDSEQAQMECWEALAETLELPGIRDVYISICGTTREETCRIMKEAYGADFPFEELNRKAYEMRDLRYADGLPLKEGIRELLDFLKENQIKIALATSTYGERARKELEDVGLLSYFDVLVTGEMAEKSKPDPEIFLKAIHLLGVPAASCMIIEDSMNGIRAAAKTGAEAVLVPDLKQPDAEIRELCDRIYPSLTALLGEITKVLPVFPR